MPRHTGASNYHDGSLKARTRRSRKNRGHKLQSRKDKALNAQRSQQ